MRLFICTSVVLTCQSGPGNILVTLPILHKDEVTEGQPVSLPSWLWCLVRNFSTFPRFAVQASRFLERLPRICQQAPVIVSIFFCSGDLGCTTWGSEPSGRPINKALGATGSWSAKSAETYHSGLEFRMASVSMSTVLRTFSRARHYWSRVIKPEVIVLYEESSVLVVGIQDNSVQCIKVRIFTVS